MEWEFVVALALAIPIILFPAAFVWYLNIGGIYTAIKEARERRAVRRHKSMITTESEQIVAMAANKRHLEKQLIGSK